MLADCHTHLDQYDSSEVPGILERARAAGVVLIIVAATTLKSCELILNLTRAHTNLYAGIGLHPMDMKAPLDDATLQQLYEFARSDPKVIAVSEVGLDFMPNTLDRIHQENAFRAEIRLARETRLPIIFHSRNSNAEVLQILREENADEVGGAWHYFQGTLEEAQEAMATGFCISLAKTLLRLPDLQAVVRDIPLEKIVLETDSYPQSWKKKRENWTEPHHVSLVAEKLAEIKGVSITEVAAATSKNLGKVLKGRVPQLAG